MTSKLRRWLLFLIFLNGYVSLSLELVVLRQLGFFVGSSAVITSIIMGTFLGFMSLGYFKGAGIRVKKMGAKSILGGSFVIIAAMGVLAGSFTLISTYFSVMYAMGIQSGVAQTFVYSLIFLSGGPFLFGVNTALLSRYLNKFNINSTGSVMAWDTIGSVMGSLATTLLLMPFIGVNYTILMITTLALVGAYVARPVWHMAIWAAVILIPAYMINSNAFLLRRSGILVNNANSTISVTDFGPGKILYMNGLPMSVHYKHVDASAEYINYINHNFIYNIPTDRVYDILILGAGGFTVGLNDERNNYTFVDIERTLKDISEKYFLGQKLTPNKKFVVQDASQFLKNTPEKYDLIMLDVYSNSYQVPEDLITAEFLQRIKSRVKDGGIVVMNMVTSPHFADTYTQVFDNTFHAVFTSNTARQTIGYADPWRQTDPSNIMYIWYNRPNDGRIYTINKTPVIYDRY
ncbi:MAG: fused MFS/spermidine synthase [Alphaproteobacteria bacterium]|nr:fused MFS/spermidine synthase [Alphaproteobacteria bacterium]